jgi:hypothetical protein
MGKKLTPLLQRPFYPYLYGLSFVAYKSARYFPSFSFIQAVGFLLCFCLLCYGCMWLLQKLSPATLAGVSTVVFCASILHVATVAQAIGYEYSAIPNRFYLAFYAGVLVLIGVLQWLPFRPKEDFLLSFNKTANVFLVIIAIVFLINGFVYKANTYGRTTAGPVAGKSIPAAKQKDIVWFLLDEYPSAISLKQQFGFDNPMEKELVGDGFVVLDSMKTRFNNTLFSLNAIFNKDDSVAPANFYAGIRSLEQNAWIKELDNSGYEIINLGFFDLGHHPKLEDRSGYPRSYLQQLTTGTLINALINTSKYSIPQCDQYTNEILQRLDDTLNTVSAHRRFIWVHLGIPHEPFCRNSSGQLVDGHEIDMSGDTTIVKKQFVEYLEYGNKILLSILKKHPDLFQKILVVSGDHGPRYGFLKHKEYQKWPLASVMIPGKYDTTGLRNLRYLSQIPSFLMQHLAN